MHVRETFLHIYNHKLGEYLQARLYMHVTNSAIHFKLLPWNQVSNVTAVSIYISILIYIYIYRQG